MSASAESLRRMRNKRRRWEGLPEAQQNDERNRQRDYDNAYYQKNRVLKLQREKARYEANRERAKQQAALVRQRVKADPERYARFKKTVKASRRAYVAANRETLRQKNREYYQKHKAESFARVQKRNALKQAATVNLRGIVGFVKSVKAKPFATCYYCDKRVPSSRVHFDHIIPLSGGGQHAVENLCVSCDTCNLSKGAKPLAEWTRDAIAQQLLPL